MSTEYNDVPFSGHKAEVDSPITSLQAFGLETRSPEGRLRRSNPVAWESAPSPGQLTA
jgi:hypothetical protein